MTRRWTFALGAVAIVTTAVLARVLLRDRFEPGAILPLVRASKDAVWAVPAFVLTYCLATAVLMPAIAMHIAAGAVWGFGHGWVLGIIGANIASNAQFLVGRWVGPERVRAWLLKRGMSRLVDELEQRGAFTMIVVRQLPLPFVVVNATAGASPMRWPQFAIGNAIGLLPNATLYTYFASVLAEGVEGARTEVLLRALAAGAVAITFGLVSRRLMASRAS